MHELARVISLLNWKVTNFYLEIRINVERFAESTIERKTIITCTKAQKTKIRVINASKLYEKCLLKIQSVKRFNTEKQMRKLRTFDPKAFYKILKQPNKTNNLPPLDDLSRFFLNLNKGKTDENEMQLNLNDIDSESDNVLNRKIEEREITRAIKQLKTGKAPGIDNIINEYIKTTTDMVLKKTVYWMKPKLLFDKTTYCTTDHLLKLYSLIEIKKKRKIWLFCAFIHFQKAFDLISRTYLWPKKCSN